MEARLSRAVILAATVLSFGATYPTTNFVVTAPTEEFARAVGETAETCRRELAVQWLGSELPRWPQPCPIQVQVGEHLGAGGATSFSFSNGQPFGWVMTIQGSRQRILDSVVPHEVTHTIFATHFGRPLPRWADEGACTTVEHISERQKQHHLLLQFLTTGRGIAFNRMFAMKEYPQDVLPLYAQGYSLARFLIAQRGRRHFIQYVGNGMRLNNWTMVTREHYGFDSLYQLQEGWLDWIRKGSSTAYAKQMLASRLGQTAPEQSLAGGPSAMDRETPQTNIVPAGGTRGAVPLAAISPASPAGRDRGYRASVTSGGGTHGKDSWYARQRERVASRPQHEAAVQPSSGDLAVSQSTSKVGHSLSHPQGVQVPRETVIDWGRMSGGLSTAPDSARTRSISYTR